MLRIGIDLGGTNIAAGVVDEGGKIIAKASVPTLAKRPTEEIVSDMAKLCETVTEKAGCKLSDITSVGIGVPGTVDDKNGMVVYACNVPMANTPLAGMLRKYADKPIHLENDANAAALGEYIVNGNGAKSFVFITLGTGVGGGIILDGKIYCGFNGAGGELGHMTLVSGGIECACGKKGCWEQYASVSALVRQTKAVMDKNPDSIMHEIVKNYGKVSGRTAFEAAKKGDKAAETVVRNYLRYVADGITSIVNIFQPEKVLIGGGISHEGDYLLKPVCEFVNKYDYNRYMPKTKIEISTLFNDAGIIGAAML